MSLSLLQSIADTAATVSEIVPAPVQQEVKMSYFELAKAGGWLMIVLLLLSIVAVYIFASKWWMIHKAGKVEKNFMNEIRDLIHEGKIKSAVSLCQRYDTPSARLVEKGIERIGRPLQDIQTAVENMGSVEVARLEKGLPMLATIAGGAPMIGFLGTVTGMIRAFFNMSTAGSNHRRRSCRRNPRIFRLQLLDLQDFRPRVQDGIRDHRLHGSPARAGGERKGIEL